MSTLDNMNLQTTGKSGTLFTSKNLFLFVLFLLLLPEHLIHIPGLGIDPSWQIALNMAVRKGFIFGKDFIFTYGPLGFLETHLGMGIPYGNLWVFLFEISLTGVILLIVSRLLKENHALLDYIILFFAVYNLSYVGASFKIAVIILFFLLQNIKKINHYSLTLVSVLLIIQFFIKPSTALYFFAIFLFTILYISIFKGAKRVLVYPLVIGVITYFLSRPLNVDLPGYLTTTFYLSRTYSDTVNGLFFNKYEIVLFLVSALIFIFSLFIIMITKFLKAKEKDIILKSVIVLLFFFFLFKQSYVRFDLHLINFWGVALMAVLIFRYHTFHLINRFSEYIYILIFVISISAFSFLSRLLNNKYPFPLPVNYFTELMVPQTTNLHFKETQSIVKLPDSILNIIGNNSIDAIPWDISSIYFNKLNYRPRPIIQSYITSSKILNTYNLNYYKNKKSSEFILFENRAIDNRYPFWSESLVKQFLISDYEPVDSLFVWKEGKDTSFLLKKRTAPLKSTESLIQNTEIVFNKKYNVPKTNNLIYLSADIKYSVWGKLLKFLYQPPIIYIRLFFEDGLTDTYRIVVPEIKHGVIINKKIITQEDAYLLFKYQGRKNENITGFVIRPEKAAYKPKIKIELREQSYLQ